MLFDIYHVQIMQGDIITRIRQYHPSIGHYHVAGVPGRGEIGGDQEINYPPILRENPGYRLQRLRRHRDRSHPPDPIESLREAARIATCDARTPLSPPAACRRRAD